MHSVRIRTVHTHTPYLYPLSLIIIECRLYLVPCALSYSSFSPSPPPLPSSCPVFPRLTTPLFFSSGDFCVFLSQFDSFSCAAIKSLPYILSPCLGPSWPVLACPAPLLSLLSRSVLLRQRLCIAHIHLWAYIHKPFPHSPRPVRCVPTCTDSCSSPSSHITLHYIALLAYLLLLPPFSCCGSNRSH